MTLVFPYSLDLLSDRFKTVDSRMGIQRNDDTSGNGWGQMWAAELAPPLWTAEISFSTRVRDPAHTRYVDASIRALGINKTMLYADCAYLGPALDPLGTILAASNVTVKAVGTYRDTLQFQGFPVGYQLTAGDRFSIVYSSTRYYMAELSESGVVNGSGDSPVLSVFPYVPLGIAPGAQTEWKQPRLTMYVPAGGHTPFQNNLGFVANNSTLKLVQKV